MRVTSGKIDDVKCLEGALVVQIIGASPPGQPERKSCIAVLNSVDYEWLATAPTSYRIVENGRSIEWPDIGCRITLDDLLQHAIIYHLRWSPGGWRNLPVRDEVAGCWRTPTGFILLHHSGLTKIKLVGKGSSGDVDGDWTWKWLSGYRFEVERVDVPAEKKNAWRQVYAMSRYDGRILETVCWSLFNLEPRGIPEVQLWTREQFPKSWQKWT